MIKDNENLWNITKHKHERVTEYITNLEADMEKWKGATISYFNKIKAEALDCATANEALELIGYKYKEMPKLVKDCWDRS